VELDSPEWLIDLSDTEPASVLVSDLEQPSYLLITSSSLDNSRTLLFFFPAQSQFRCQALILCH